MNVLNISRVGTSVMYKLNDVEIYSYSSSDVLYPLASPYLVNIDSVISNVP